VINFEGVVSLMIGVILMVFIMGAVLGYTLGNGMTLGIIQRAIGYP
jgi:hypothetical protein